MDVLSFSNYSIWLKILLAVLAPLACFGVSLLFGLLYRVSKLSYSEMNEGEYLVEEKVSRKEARQIRKIGRWTFAFLGLLLWGLNGFVLGRLLSDISIYSSLNVVIQFVAYLLLLRIPFGVSFRSIMKNTDEKLVVFKLTFALTMIVSFLLGINIDAS